MGDGTASPGELVGVGGSWGGCVTLADAGLGTRNGSGKEPGKLSLLLKRPQKLSYLATSAGESCGRDVSSACKQHWHTCGSVAMGSVAMECLTSGTVDMYIGSRNTGVERPINKPIFVGMPMQQDQQSFKADTQWTMVLGMYMHASCIYESMHVCMYMYMHMRMYMCMYTYMYVYI